MSRRVKAVARNLETVPHEIVELVIAGLRLKDIIELFSVAGPSLNAAIRSSPAWKRVWPQEPDHVAQLTTLYFNVVQKTPRAFGHVLRKARWGTKLWVGPYYLDFTAAELQKELGSSCADPVINNVSRLLGWVIKRTKTLRVLEKYYDGPSLHPWISNARPHRALMARSANSLDGSHPMVNYMEEFTNRYLTAQSTLNATKKEQVLALARLYETHPALLKTPFAPQSRRPNQSHIVNWLGLCANRIARCVDLGNASPQSYYCRSLFFLEHAYLVPYDWCLILWFDVLRDCPALFDESGDDQTLLQQIKKMAPEKELPSKEIKQYIHTANSGLLYCYRVCPVRTCRERTGTRYCIHYDQMALEMGGPTRRINYSHRMGLPPSFYVDRSYHADTSPTDTRELDWLMAFTKAVAWMQDTFPEAARKVLEARASGVMLIEADETARRQLRANDRKERRKAAREAHRMRVKQWTRGRY